MTRTRLAASGLSFSGTSWYSQKGNPGCAQSGWLAIAVNTTTCLRTLIMMKSLNLMMMGTTCLRTLDSLSCAVTLNRMLSRSS